ncbi:uncharacterized protein LOC124809247 isoform X5 [Hydra vulgaris]|uniref:uncharacterized protein LOC124809247 isoform X5 n=1 Tax=Hydra vulgaris TaxID=6087 RepID=UPI001F5E3ED8|nr:uncharacterized protein LOC124809247 isoform X5 [Hydra vulgaris]
MSDGVLDDICCVLCNRKGLKSGGTIGDHCICKDCANCSGGIVPNDEYFGRAFQKFSTDNLKEIASSQLLKSIFLGQLYSYRHNIFKTGGDAKKSLCDIWLVDLLSDDQVHTLYNALVRSYNNLKHNDYVLKVLVPEAILYLFAKVEKISRIKAEVVLNSYISERYHENESQNSDSCKSDVNCVSRNENILLNKLKKEEKIKKNRLSKWVHYSTDTNTIEDKKENELPKNIHIDLCIEDSETFLVKNLLSYLIEKVCNYIDGNDVDFNIQNPQCPTSSCSKKYLNESVFTLSGEEKKVNLEMDMHQVKKKKYLNESDFTFSGKEKKVNLEMDMHQVEKKKYLNESDFTFSGKEKKVNLEMDMHQVEKKKYLNESDFLLSGKRVSPKNIKRTKEPIVKRGKKACPVPGCKSVIINLSRHIKESKKMDHIILKRSASKVVSLFGLRKSCAKSCDVIRPRKSVTKSCPVDGCLSTILNLSDHFRKSHPSIYNNAELYDEMKKKAIVISENDKEQIMSIFPSNNPLPSDDSYDSENGSAKIASDKYKKFISQIDSSTDTDSDYIAELDETDESNDEYLPDDINEESINAVLNNFEIHLLGFEGGKKKEKPARQCKNQVKCILNCISPTLTSLDPLFNLQTLREKWLPWALAPGKGKNGKGHLPGTLRSYLGSLSKFIEFLIRQKTVSWAKKMFVPCTINLDVMKGLLKDIKNWSASYCDEVDEREWDVLEKDLANMIDPDEFQKVYNSELSQQARKLLNNSILFEESDFSKENFVTVRDYLASLCCLRNSARAGNCINMLLSEFQAAKVDKTTNNIIVNVKVHKTKRKYGSAQVVLTPDMNTQMRCYVDVFRDKVARMNEKDPLDPGSCLFVTWSFKSLNGFSTQLDSFWKKATKSNRQCLVSATLIRKSITTTFYASEEINDSIKDRLANHMKHKRETASRNYNLYKTMTNAAELTNQIENKLLKTSIINSENFSNNFTSENLSDNIKLPTECISDESTSKRGWNGDEILEVKRLFQHHDFQGCYIP